LQAGGARGGATCTCLTHLQRQPCSACRKAAKLMPAPSRHVAKLRWKRKGQLKNIWPRGGRPFDDNPTAYSSCPTRQGGLRLQTNHSPAAMKKELASCHEMQAQAELWQCTKLTSAGGDAASGRCSAVWPTLHDPCRKRRCGSQRPRVDGNGNHGVCISPTSLQQACAEQSSSLVVGKASRLCPYSQVKSMKARNAHSRASRATP
jgi:hypothetical protein